MQAVSGRQLATSVCLRSALARIAVPMMMGGVRPPLTPLGAVMLDGGTVGDLGSARLDLALLPVDEDVSGLPRDGR